MRRIFKFYFLLVFLFCFSSNLAFGSLPLWGDKGEKASLAPMLKKTIPAVVNISIIKQASVSNFTNPLFDDPFFRQFFPQIQPQKQQPAKKVQSIGSGVIIDAEKGYVVTNNHVVENAEKIFITLYNKKKIEAKLIGTDKETDIALLKVKEKNLTDIKIGKSNELEVGDFVIAIGNPFGLGQTVTSGIVSAIGRSGLGIEGYENFIQTDASINPGNSGGALINLNGALIGINTAIITPQKGNIGIGFAIPSNMVKKVVAQLIKHGKIKRTVLGINIQDLNHDIAKALGEDKYTQGALIVQVEDDSIAEKSDLRENDIVVAFNDEPIKSASDLRNAVGLSSVGDEIVLKIIRDGKAKDVKIKLKESKNIWSAKDDFTLKGVVLSPIPSSHPLYNKVEGVLVRKVDIYSDAWKAGLKINDIICEVNKKNIKSVQDFKNVLSANKSSNLLLKVRRDNYIFLMIVKMS